MNKTMQDLLDEAKALPAKDRAFLAGRLLLSAGIWTANVTVFLGMLPPKPRHQLANVIALLITPEEQGCDEDTTRWRPAPVESPQQSPST